MRSDPPAQLAVLLAMTGLTQTDAAALLGVAGRSMRRWIEGAQPPPAVVIERLAALARELDQVADQLVSAINQEESEQAILLVYRRDDDVPAWTGLPTAGCHLAMVRRVVERRPDVQLVSYHPGAYRRWLGCRPDSDQMRAGWAASCLARL